MKSEGNEKETGEQVETLVSIPGPGPLAPIGTPKPQRAIDWTRPVQTVGSKRPVHIYAIDHRLKKPVIGYDSFFDSLGQWYYDGSWDNNSSTCLDLENIPEVPHV